MLVIKWPAQQRCPSVNQGSDSTERHGRGKAFTDLLARGPDCLVVFVEDDADLVHEPDLLLIVTVELRGTGGIDVGEEAQDGLSSDCRGLRSLDHSRYCRHFDFGY